MQCPTCGRHIHRKSIVCHYCGQHFGKEEREGKEKRKERNMTRKHIAALFFVIILGFSLVYFLQYETEDADRLVRAARKEVERGSELLEKVEAELTTLKEIEFESADNINACKEYASQSKEKVQALLLTIDEASTFFDRAEEFLEKAEKLRIPSWYRQYVYLEKEIVAKYKEYVSILETVSTNCSVYYEFAECYFEGEQCMTGLMDDMDRGTDNLERGDYQFAVAAYETALQQIREAQKEYVSASKLIDLPYINDFLSNLSHMERALYSLSEAARQLDLGNVDEANLLASLGTKELESLVPVNRGQLKAQITDWYTTYIAEGFQHIEHLRSEIAELEREAEALRK